MVLTGSSPNLNEHSLSKFLENLWPLASLSPQGSDHKRSQRKPLRGGSINLSNLSISATVYNSGEIPPCMHK